MKTFELVAAAGFGVCILAGCGNVEDPSPPPQAQGVGQVPGPEQRRGTLPAVGELDLSTPESFVESYVTVCNMIYAGQAEPGDDMKKLFDGYTPKDLEDQIRTCEQALQGKTVMITGYKIVQIQQMEGGVEVSVEMTGTIYDKTIGTTKGKRMIEKMILQSIDGSYKRTRW